MSVAFRTPQSGTKRLFEEGGVPYGSPEDHTHCSTGSVCGVYKRPRFVSSHLSSQLSRSPPAASPLGGPPRERAVHRLREMFPDVDEKIIERLLDAHGDNIEAAIEQLHQLRLSSSNGDEHHGTAHHQEMATNAQSGHCGSSNTTSDRLSTSWLDTFLKQFYESKQPEEARARVSRVLEEFESAVISKQRSESGEWVALKTEFDKLKKDNVILSKAVAVQHSRLQELGGKEQELQCMRELLAQYQDRLRTLELTNYSLTMHLQQATGPPFGPRNGGPPDVF